MFDYNGKLEETHRIDIQNRKPTPKNVEEQLVANFYDLAEKVDAIICLEQLKNGTYGVFTSAVIAALTNIARQKPDLVIMADSRFHALDFERMIVKCNDLEAVRAVYPGKNIAEDDEIADDLLHECMMKISSRTGKHVFASCGSRGMKVLENGIIETVSAYKVEGPIDICGAGDSATGAICSSLSAGASPKEAALIGNLVASITIQQLGVTGIATVPQILLRNDAYNELYQ